MIQVDNLDIIEQHQVLVKMYKSGASAPLFGLDYLQAVFPKLNERAMAARIEAARKKGIVTDSAFPYEVKLPKSLSEMKEGDFSPTRILTITEPFEGPGCPMWFGSTIDGINFRWGYINGDSRRIDTTALNDNSVHGFLAGATGQGKSVTVNAVIYGCCLEYPPWELTLTLSDAKIVEFKTIALKHPMPQIDIVAATSDTDYLISMLQTKYKEMNDRQQVFTKAGEVFGKEVKNIKQFREVTGLCMPRILMMFDECTAMFQVAGKKCNKLVDLLDSFARLGRNAGIHLFMDSQEVSSDLPQNTLGNLKLRSAMGCTAAVSERILGNTAAAENYGKKGRMIVNEDSGTEDNTDKNRLVRVPYYTDAQINQVADTVIVKGKELNVGYEIQYYDEEAKLYEDKYQAFIESFECRGDRLLLGPPSYIIQGEQVVTVPIGGDDIQNICAVVNSSNSKLRVLKMLKANMLLRDWGQHLIWVADPFYEREGKLDDLNPGLKLEDKNFKTSTYVAAVKSTLYQRMLAITVDKVVFDMTATEFNTDTKFYEVFQKESEYDSLLNRRRFNQCIAYLTSDAEIMSGFGLSGGSSDAEKAKVVKLATLCVKTYTRYGCQNVQLTTEKLPNVWLWVLGMERILGLGRDIKSNCVETFKRLLLDSSTYNVRFIILTSSMDGLKELNVGLGYYLADDLSTKQIRDINAQDDYPEKLNGGLMVIFRPGVQTDDRLRKFKKLMFKGEY